MARKMTTTDKAARDDHFAQHDSCWLCTFLMRRQLTRTELHHIAARGNRHEVRENFCALCTACHKAIQSRKDAELLCLALKFEFDEWFYSPQTVCALRGNAATRWTHNDVLQAGSIMRLMREINR